MKTGVATIPLKREEILYNSTHIDRIPDQPKIPLKNYLLDLVTGSDGKESSIYLKGVEKFIQEIWNEMVKNKWRKLKIDLPKILDIHPQSIYAYKNGKKAISIQMMYKLLLLWRKYCKKSNKQLQEKWNEIYNSEFTFSSHKSTETKLPKYLTPKLSYLLGWLCGDGHIEDRWKHYIIKISEKSTSQLNFIIKPLLRELFNIYAPIFRIYQGGNAIQFGNKPILRFFKRVLKIEVGRIPEIVKNSDLVNKKYFLIGIFDSEGNISFSHLSARISISQSDYKFLIDVINLFKELDIYFNGPYFHRTDKGCWYRIEINKKLYILKFLKEIGTLHVEKFKKAKILEKRLNAHGYCYNST